MKKKSVKSIIKQNSSKIGFISVFTLITYICIVYIQYNDIFKSNLNVNKSIPSRMDDFLLGLMILSGFLFMYILISFFLCFYYQRTNNKKHYRYQYGGSCATTENITKLVIFISSIISYFMYQQTKKSKSKKLFAIYIMCATPALLLMSLIITITFMSVPYYRV